MSIQSDIQGAYVAFFNRPADPAGLAYWSLQAAATGGSLAGVINAFSASDEYKSLYGAKSEEEIVQSIYLNLFGREAETAGVDYWAVRLRSGFFNVGNIAWSIFVGAQHDDALAVHNKVMLAVEFTNALDTPDEVAGFSTDSGLAAAKDFLSGVDGSADSVAHARAGMEDVLHGLIPSDDDSDDTDDSDDDSDSDHDSGDDDSGGSTPFNVTLTTAVDSIQGSSGKDTFNATELTLTAGDTIDAGAGTDTLKIVTHGYLLTPPAISATGLEILAIEANSSTAIDASQIRGLTDLQVQGAGLNLAVTGLRDAIDVSVSGRANVGLSLSFTAGVAGAAKTLDLALDGSQVTLLSTKSADNAEFGKIQLTAKGADSILGGLGHFSGTTPVWDAATTTLVATGTSLALNHAGNLRSVDFSALTGRSSVYFDGPDGVNFQGGAAGSKVGIVTVTAGDVLHAGSGSDDWLYLSGNGPGSSGALAGVTGFEHLGFNASGSVDATMNVGLFQASQSIASLSAIGGDNNVFSPNYADTDGEVFTFDNVRTATLQNITVGLTDADDSVVIRPSDMSLGGSDVGQVTLTSPTVVFPAAWDYAALGGIMTMSVLQYDRVDVLALNVSAQQASAALSASDLDTLVITGNALSLRLDSTTRPALIASSGTLSLDLSARGSASVTVTTSNGDDQVVLSATASNGDKLQLGAGSDAAVLSINGMRDRIVYTATAIGSGDIVKSADTIRNFDAGPVVGGGAAFSTGEDVIELSHNLLTLLKVGNTNLFSQGAAVTLGNGIGSQNNIAAIDNGNTTKIVIDINGDGQFRADNDMSIELIGVTGHSIAFDAASELFYAA